jgi:SAM-dependent methyltransferase
MDSYHPLSSVWEGSDAELLELMLLFYPRRPPEGILDATVNRGRFWKGSPRKVTGMDVDPSFRPTVVGDNSMMPFADGSFDVVVYDPPHTPDHSSGKSRKDFRFRFGLGAKSGKETSYSFSFTYPGFLREASRVLRPEGVLLCKVSDYVHNHRYQWAHMDLAMEGRKAGFTPCDLIVKVRRGPIVDPRWKKAHHSRRRHCYWLVLRKSPRCE